MKKRTGLIVLLVLVLTFGAVVPCYGASRSNALKAAMKVQATIWNVVSNTLQRVAEKRAPKALDTIKENTEKVLEQVAEAPEEAVEICVEATADYVADLAEDIIETGQDYCDEKEITMGNVVRDLQETYDVKDFKHLISPYDPELHCGQSVTLRYPEELGTCLFPSYQWYTCDNPRGLNGCKVKGATARTYETGTFSEPEIRYYYCVMSGWKLGLYTFKRSCVFAVGYTGLPTVYINTPAGHGVLTKEYVEGAQIAVVRSEDEAFELESTEMRIKGRGNATWRNTAKNGYTFKFEKKKDLFSMGKNKTWSLIGNFADKSLLRNWLGNVLDAEVFNAGPWDNALVPVDLVVDGEYRGSYNLSTTIKIGDNRVDIPDISEADGPDTYEQYGFIVELDLDDEAYSFVTNQGYRFNLKDPDLDDPTKAEKNEQIYAYIKNTVCAYEDVLYSANFADTEEGYAKYLDVDSFIDWYLLEELSKNVDGRFNRSTSIYFDPTDQKLHMAPIWDSDSAFGNHDGEEEKPEGFLCQTGWYARLFEDPAFAARAAERWNEVSDQVSAIVNTRIAEEAQKIRLSRQMDYSRWSILNLPNRASGIVDYLLGDMQSEIDYLINWMNERIAWLDQAFAEK